MIFSISKNKMASSVANDTKSCYDRISHSIASLVLQRTGLPVALIISIIKSLQKMKDHVRTGYSISASTYGGVLRNGKPTQGSDQVHGASPCIWVMISTPL